MQIPAVNITVAHLNLNEEALQGNSNGYCDVNRCVPMYTFPGLLSLTLIVVMCSPFVPSDESNCCCKSHRVVVVGKRFQFCQSIHI